MSKLIIVESPAKAKTIEKYLGSEYKVLATFGHVRDLPSKNIGIEVEKNFEPKYVIPPKSKKTIQTLKKGVESANLVLLATDPDREGEAISWHVAQALKLKKDKYRRIEFHEITKEAVTHAVNHPRDINADLVDAQQARRVLDRLVGYTLSPLLWRKIKRGLSAGRVQSVAVKLIVDREREIEAFKPIEYWEVSSRLAKNSGEEFDAKLTKKDGQPLEIHNQEEAEKTEAELKDNDYIVQKIDTKEVKRRPAAPFITSTLQQEGARKLYFSAKKTMVLAQQLYEGIDIGKEGTIGLITYMRTDSTNLSNESISQARKYISDELGKEYLPDKPRIFKKAKAAQEAHEAIRPTSIFRTPESVKDFLSKDQLKLYELIWKRTLASQIADCIYIQTGVDISCGNYLFHAGGRVIKFPGFMNVYIEGDEAAEKDKIMPELTEGEKLKLKKLSVEQKFTEPPARYNEASLIKELEANGIGRPSTYAPIISTIQDRGYVTLENRRFIPTEIGFIVTDMLADNFPFVVSVDFTAQVENDLDDIADGNKDWQKIVGDFWHPFNKDLEKAQTSIEKVKIEKPTDEVCELCGRPMVIKMGRFGEFMACSGYPECKNTKPIAPKSTGMKCPKCGEGDIVERKTRRGKLFWGCSRFPDCDFASWTKPKEEKKESRS